MRRRERIGTQDVLPGGFKNTWGVDAAYQQPRARKLYDSVTFMVAGVEPPSGCVLRTLTSMLAAGRMTPRRGMTLLELMVTLVVAEYSPWLSSRP